MSNLFPTKQEKDALRQALTNFVETRNELVLRYPGLDIFYDLFTCQSMGEPTERLVINDITYIRKEK